MAASSPTPGMLFVTMQPKDSLPLEQFHDWYNNEHGPTRLTMPFVLNGFRYRATDLQGSSSGSQDKPEYLAIYDITDMHELTQDLYMKYRSAPWKTQREADTMAQIHVGRTLWDDLGEETNEKNFFKLESPDNFEKAAEGNALTTTRFLVERENLDKASEWVRKSVVSAMAEVPGWRRTRWYKKSYLDSTDSKQLEILIIHEFTPSTDLQSLPAVDVTSVASSNNTHRTYKLFYTFGAAARELAIVRPWKSHPGTTRTMAASSSSYSASAIESTVTTTDGTVIPFRLEGSSTDPNAPVVVLVNSVLTTYGIWDGFVKHFLSQPQNQKYRVLRFLSRGRYANTGSTSPITVDVLASDIIHLLDTLRIPQVDCLVGVSLGGATTLATALKYPSRIKTFVSCDTSPKSPAGNRETWGQRIAVAEKEGQKLPVEPSVNDNTTSAEVEPVVGEELAEMTVRRWFVPESYENTQLASEIERVKKMVVTNSLPGFSRGVEALFNYDYTQLLAGYKGRGAFLVGAGDGVLPKGMEETSKKLGSNGGEFKLVQNAGHLPMVEQPQEVAEFVAEFLKKA